MTLKAVGVDIDCNGNNCEEDLMFDEVSLVEKFIEDICFFEFD